MNILQGFRFKNFADAEEFMKTNDLGLAVPQFIVLDGKSCLNPDWEAAPFESSIVFYENACQVVRKR